MLAAPGSVGGLYRASEKGFEVVRRECLLFIRPFNAAAPNSDQLADVVYYDSFGKQLLVEICPAQIESVLEIITRHARSCASMNVLPRFVVEPTRIALLPFLSVVVLPWREIMLLCWLLRSSVLKKADLYWL